jgi:hypothetical protein
VAELGKTANVQEHWSMQVSENFITAEPEQQQNKTKHFA